MEMVFSRYQARVNNAQCREEVVGVVAAAGSVAGEVDGGGEERRAAAVARG